MGIVNLIFLPLSFFIQNAALWLAWIINALFYRWPFLFNKIFLYTFVLCIEMCIIFAPYLTTKTKVMSIQLKPQHQDSVLGRMIETKNLIKYYESVVIPEINELKEWEQKEYWSSYHDCQKQFEDYKQYIKENEPAFNLLLCQYNLSVATFVYTLNHC